MPVKVVLSRAELHRQGNSKWSALFVLSRATGRIYDTGSLDSTLDGHPWHMVIAISQTSSGQKD